MFNLEVPMHQPGWDQALGERVKWMANQNVQVAEIRLNPPSLGPLEVRVHVEGDRTHVNFLAPQATTREAIDAALPRLREMFAEGGLSLGDVTVSHQDARQARGQNGEGSGQGGAQGNDQGHEEGATLNNELSPSQGLGLVDYYA
jgi:flagellar hook-length control protein FliK